MAKNFDWLNEPEFSAIVEECEQDVDNSPHSPRDMVHKYIDRMANKIIMILSDVEGLGPMEYQQCEKFLTQIKEAKNGKSSKS